jgi:hypothetical protein
MSYAARPISPTAFAAAIRDLPLDNVYAKAAELRNAMAHLASSNAQLAPLATAGDAVCADAVRENEEVLQRMEHRLLLLRFEVEVLRGLKWEEEGGKVEQARRREDGGEDGTRNGERSGEGDDGVHL